MSELPQALRAWREPLGLLQELVPAGIGPWLLPLRSLFGPMRIPKRARVGDPDGVDGLSRRGDYDRLLLSEWAIALDLPDEFLRRAAMGEHVFLAPAFREPHGAHTSVALLDCGPSQLGTPRLAHLAALVVLQQRAADHGAEFRFGLLSDRTATLHRLTQPGISAWLYSRTWASPASDQAQWRDRLEEVDAEDTWVLGGPDSADVATRLRASWVGITPPVRPSRRLVLRARRFGTTGDRVELPLPSDETCVRILRQPLGPTTRPTIPVDASERVAGAFGQLTLDGRRMFLPQRDGSIHAYHVAHNARDSAGRTKKLLAMPGSRLVGADLFGRRLVAISVSDQNRILLRGAGLIVKGVYGSPNTASTIVDTGIALPESFGLLPAALVTLFVAEAGPTKFRAWVLDHRAQLWALVVEVAISNREIARASFEVVDRACRQVTRVARDTVVWVSDSQHRVVATTITDEPPAIEADALQHVVFGAHPRHAPRMPPMAWPRKAGPWRIAGLPPDAVETSAVPEGRVIGIAWDDGWNERLPQLIVLAADRQTINSVSTTGVTCLYRSIQPIEAIEHHPCSQQIVARNALDEVFVLDVKREQVVLRVAPPSTKGAGA